MSNIYLKVTIEKNWRSQNFDFLSLKSFSLGQSWRAPTHANIWEQNCGWLFYFFDFERNYDVLKSKSSSILLNKNINFN